MKTKIIFNPKAAQGKAEKYFPEIMQKFQNSGFAFESELTRYQGHAEEIAAQAVRENYFKIIAVGGDGTINETINGIFESKADVIFGVIPVGTCNDFIKTMRIPYDVNKACEIIIDNYYKEIDVGKVGNRYFVNAAGIGFDVDVVVNLKKSRIKGTAAYLWTVLKQIFRYKGLEIIVNDGEQFHHPDAFMLTVANGKYYGGQFKIAPEADVCDGLLDVVLVKNQSVLKKLQILPKFIKGTHTNIAAVEMKRSNGFKITAGQNITLQIEGELCDWNSNEISFSIHPQSLKVLAPNNKEEN